MDYFLLFGNKKLIPTSGIYLQTQKCMQTISWEQTGVPDQLKRIYAAAAAAAAKLLQSCPTLCDLRRQSTRFPRVWDSPGKNTGVGCQFLLKCMKVKSENEVTQSCPTLRDPLDCSLRGSSTHGIFQARVLEWGAIAFSRKEYIDPHKTW